MYMFNSKELAERLVAAQKRGVKVVVVLDSLCLTDPYSKAEMLSNAGISVYVRKKKGKGIRKGIMHLKFLHRLGNKDAFGGSYNYTKAAEKVNDDFVMYIEDQMSIVALEKEFNKLLAESIPYKEVALPEDMK